MLQVPLEHKTHRERAKSNPMRGREELCILVVSANDPVSCLEDTCKYTSTKFPSRTDRHLHLNVMM